jgi:GMP synthase-like glutamine amidotransferase
VVSHSEEVKALPPGFHKTCERQEVLFDGLEHDQLPIFTFQFHPDAAEEFLQRRGVPYTELDIAKIEEDSRRLLAAFHRVAAGVAPG